MALTCYVYTFTHSLTHCSALQYIYTYNVYNKQYIISCKNNIDYVVFWQPFGSDRCLAEARTCSELVSRTLVGPHPCMLMTSWPWDLVER